MKTGRILSVWLERHGSRVREEVPAGTAVVPVEFTGDFAEDGGSVIHQPSGVIYEYVSADNDAETLTLLETTGETWSVSDPLYVWPLTNDVLASVRLDEDEADAEPITARVAHSLRPLLPEGVRDTLTGEVVSVALERLEWVVRDLYGQVPVIDGTLIDPGTIPGPDGVVPASSPTPTIQSGIGSLFVRWDPVVNHDPVTYEVHISATPGFNPSTSTLAVEMNGTLSALRRLPDGSPFVYGQTYYVRLIAKDEDGAAPAGVEASGQVAQATGEDIAVNTVTTDHLVANAVTADEIAAQSITAEKLEAILALVSTLLAGNPGGSRVELGPTGIQAYDGTGSQTVNIDAATGDVSIVGALSTARTGERWVINPDNGISENIIRAYTDDPIVYNEIAATTGTSGESTIQMYCNTDGGLVSTGRAQVGPNNARLDYNVQPAGTLPSQMFVTEGQAQVSSPLVALVVDQRYTAGNGSPRVQLYTRDGNGTVINTSILEYVLGGGDAPTWLAFNKNAALQFGQGRLYCLGNNLSTRIPIEASAFPVGSSRATKDQIEPVPFPALSAVESAPSYRWEYRADQTDGDGRPKVADRHVSPMAEDLPPEIVREDETGFLTVDIRDQLGVLWEAVRELSIKVEKLQG